MPNRIRPSRPILGRDSVNAASLGWVAGDRPAGPGITTAGDGGFGATGAVETGRFAAANCGDPVAPARDGFSSMVRSHGASAVKAKIGGASVLLSCPNCTSGNPALRNPESNGEVGTVERTAGAPASESFAEKVFTALAILGFLALCFWG